MKLLLFNCIILMLANKAQGAQEKTLLEQLLANFYYVSNDTLNELNSGAYKEGEGDFDYFSRWFEGFNGSFFNTSNETETVTESSTFFNTNEESSVEDTTSFFESEQTTFSMASEDLYDCQFVQNLSKRHLGFAQSTPNGYFVYLFDEGGTTCLNLNLNILIEVSLRRDRFIFDKWLAGFFPSLPTSSVEVTVLGDCDYNNEANVHIMWDRYALAWVFIKEPSKSVWYLRSLKLMTVRSKWFERYGFNGGYQLPLSFAYYRSKLP